LRSLQLHALQHGWTDEKRFQAGFVGEKREARESGVGIHWQNERNDKQNAGA